jgi:protease-4
MAREPVAGVGRTARVAPGAPVGRGAPVGYGGRAARRGGTGRVGRLLAALFLSPALGACIELQLWGVPQPLEETVVYGEAGPKILLLEIDGPLVERAPEPELFGPVEDNPVSRVREQLDRAREDPEVRAVLLRINSPGGTATASDVIHGEILRFKRERGVPVVAQLMGVAASGGYYVAMAADLVVAHPTTVTGSIGVRFLSVSLAGLLEKLGIQDQTLVAGRHKDAGSPLRRMTPEERAHLQSVLDDLHARFEQVVAAGRPHLPAEGLERVADGSLFSARQALELGLVDAIGDLEESVGRAQGAAGLPQARVVRYHRPREYANNLYTRAGTVAPTLRVELPGSLALVPRPGFYFLWAPDLE